MRLENVTPDKIAILQEICIAAYTQNFAHHWEENGLDLYLENQFSTKRMKADLANPTLQYYFIKVEEKPVGFIKIKLNASFADYKAINVAELEKMYLLPEVKGQGIGKNALYSMIKQMKDYGKKVFFLCVIDTNNAAIKFYEKLGFKYHSKTRLDIPLFKEELKGMNRMFLTF